MTSTSSTDARLRRFTLTRGRVRAESDLPMEAPVVIPDGVVTDPRQLMPEHREILSRCGVPTTVVDLSSALSTPVEVVRVLVLDLADRGALTIQSSDLPAHLDLPLLEECLNGIGNI